MLNSQSNAFIQPAGVYEATSPPPVVRIVSGIMNARTNFPGHVYHRLGDVLAAPELTVRSPYLSYKKVEREISDSVYERIPQQILGLLKGGEDPRFVVYAYGQALKPADNSLISSGAFFNLCTNYQVTAEVATRAVVRLEGLPAYPPVVGNTNAPQVLPAPIGSVRAVVESFNVLPPDN